MDLLEQLPQLDDGERDIIAGLFLNEKTEDRDWQVIQ